MVLNLNRGQFIVYILNFSSSDCVGQGFGLPKDSNISCFSQTFFTLLRTHKCWIDPCIVLKVYLWVGERLTNRSWLWISHLRSWIVAFSLDCFISVSLKRPTNFWCWNLIFVCIYWCIYPINTFFCLFEEMKVPLQFLLSIVNQFIPHNSLIDCMSALLLHYLSMVSLFMILITPFSRSTLYCFSISRNDRQVEARWFNFLFTSIYRSSCLINIDWIEWFSHVFYLWQANHLTWIL